MHENDVETEEMEVVHPTTVHIGRVRPPVPDSRRCAYCNIPLSALPTDQPMPVFAPGGSVVHTHGVCAGPYRIRGGIHPDYKL